MGNEPSFSFIFGLFQLILCCFFIFLFHIWKTDKFSSHREYIEIYFVLYWGKNPVFPLCTLVIFYLIRTYFFAVHVDVETTPRKDVWVCLLVTFLSYSPEYYMPGNLQRYYYNLHLQAILLKQKQVKWLEATVWMQTDGSPCPSPSPNAGSHYLSFLTLSTSFAAKS